MGEGYVAAEGCCVPKGRHVNRLSLRFPSQMLTTIHVKANQN